MTRTWKKSSRSIRLQVLVCPEDYAAWYNYAAEQDISVRNDSELVRKLMQLATNTEDLDLKIYVLRNKIKMLAEDKAKDQEIISRLQTTRIQLQQDLDRLKENIKKKRRQKKK